MVWHLEHLKKIGYLITIKQNKYVAFHFNYIRGVSVKIEKMRKYKAWLKPMKIVDVPEKFQPNLNQICIDKHSTTYPPHQGEEKTYGRICP